MELPDTDALLAEAAGRPFAFIVGWPVSHSRSPLLHGFWLKERGIAGHYGRLAVAPGGAALRATFDFIRRTPAARGCNLTLPHKIDALAMLDSVAPDAVRIGAVNTIVRRDDGSLEGHNTDAFGFISALRAAVPAWRPAAAAAAAVLGAGGAARAVIAALVDSGVPEVRLVNRTRQAAIDLATQFTPDDGRTVAVDDWSRRDGVLAGAGLLVNTTSLGMSGQPALDLDLAALPPSAVVNDVVYAPLRTDLLRRAAARGNRTVDGLDMLLHQGRPGFAAWFGGPRPDVTPALRTAVAGDLGA